MTDRLAISFDPAEVGRAMAHANDEEQAAMMNAFARELYDTCHNVYAAHTQLACVKDRLADLTKDVLQIQDDTTA